ncbi:MAG: hypothetical protein HRT37_19475 [Alteromonadaceae bacterium]|nr:hypothetical protein [Alteromonadaceae bacterium]
MVLLILGAVAELYRGIAAVIVGGMSRCSVFTLIFLLSLLQTGTFAQLKNGLTIIKSMKG